MKLQFLGANGQVTGSRYLLECGGLRLLIDCGLFQERQHLSRNWERSPVPPESIDYLLLTHAHLDHCGLIPRLVAEGFDRPILTTSASVELAKIILGDSARIQEEDAKFKLKRHRREKRKGPFPVQPLYTPQNADAALKLFKPVEYDKSVSLNDNVTVTFRDAGHILGSAMLVIECRDNGSSRRMVFSGDIGQCGKPLVRDPSRIDAADFVVMESTYGGRTHEPTAPVEDQLCEVINATVEAGGNILIPTFAVERAQELMYLLGRLVRADRIPNLLAFLDSPMAVNVTDVFRRHGAMLDAEAREILDAGDPLLAFEGMKLVRSTNESKAINRIRGSCIIMAGSGMCTGGRIKHHLVRNIGRPECTIVFVGYQAHGTLGRQIAGGADEVRILGSKQKVRAKIAEIHGFSAHADQPGLVEWLGHLKSAPRRVFLTHGDIEAAEALSEGIRNTLGWNVEVPEYWAEYDLA